MWTSSPRVPKFRDYRTTNDGVMVADIGFKAQLRTLDPELDVVWDWGSAKWEIWRFPGQTGWIKQMTHNAFHVMTVQTKDRKFRELGADIILKLQKSDPTRYSVKQLCDYFDAMDDNIMRARERAFENYIESVTMESLDYIRGVPKGQVPFSYQIKPSEEKFLVNVPRSRPNHYLFKLPQKKKIERVIGGTN